MAVFVALELSADRLTTGCSGGATSCRLTIHSSRSRFAALVIRQTSAGKVLTMTLFVLVAMTFMNAAVLQTDNIQTTGIELPGLVKSTCTEIASLARTLPGLTIKESTGAVHDDKTGVDHSGCRIVGAGESVEYRDDEWPHEILRTRMTNDEWREDISRAADGAGSTAFAVRKGTVLCLFSAAWITSALSEPETSASSSYEFEVGCFEINEAG